MKTSRGFTLIELLVVIAIIGILAGIVLVSLSGARERAKDGRVISDMSQLRAAAEIVEGNDGDYDCVCSGTTTGCSDCDDSIESLITDMNAQNGTATDFSVHHSAASGATDYCAEIQLNSGKWFCVDSVLTSKQYDDNPSCAAAEFTCD